MRLATFILAKLEPILEEWEEVVRGIHPPHRSLPVSERRGHAKEILEGIAAALEMPEPTDGGLPGANAAAEKHAEMRLRAGFSVNQLVAEYCAARANIVRRWLARDKSATWFEVDDMSRFNEAMDRALADSVAYYTAMRRRSQDIFLGMVGHDLRTPLQSMILGAEFLMRSEKSEPQMIQLGSRMFNSASRMSQILDNLLDFTRSRIGDGLRVRPKPVDLAMISEQVTDELRFSHPDRTITTEVCGNVCGRWDGGRIAQIYQNLIGNALQHGDRCGEVTVRTCGEGEGVRIDVHNHGDPIPEDERAAIFDPLYRYKEPGERTNLGLGLYIVREIAMAHHGRVEVHSGAGTGTRFSVWLPRGREN